MKTYIKSLSLFSLFILIAIALIDISNISEAKFYLVESKHFINSLISQNGGINEKVINKVNEIGIEIFKLDSIDYYVVNDLCRYKISKNYISFLSSNDSKILSLVCYTII